MNIKWEATAIVLNEDSWHLCIVAEMGVSKWKITIMDAQCASVDEWRSLAGGDGKLSFGGRSQSQTIEMTNEDVVFWIGQTEVFRAPKVPFCVRLAITLGSAMCKNLPFARKEWWEYQI